MPDDIQLNSSRTACLDMDTVIPNTVRGDWRIQGTSGDNPLAALKIYKDVPFPPYRKKKKYWEKFIIA